MQLRGGVKRHCLGKEQNAVTKNAVGRADCPHENGYYAHPEYVSAAIQSFAQMPITSYLSEYPDRLKNLSACVGIFTEKDAEMSYREVAALIYQRWQVNPRI